jgi:predicted DNA-binding protein
MQTKDEQIGFRLPANLKRELHNLAKREGRTLSQICEIFVSGGLEAYRREGPKYLQRLLSRQKKENSSE